MNNNLVLAGQRAWPLDFSPGALESLKWLALGLMVIDHLNAYLWAWRYPPLYALGRLTFPLFAFVLAYNLARPGNERAADRTLVRC